MGVSERTMSGSGANPDNGSGNGSTMSGNGPTVSGNGPTVSGNGPTVSGNGPTVSGTEATLPTSVQEIFVIVFPSLGGIVLISIAFLVILLACKKVCRKKDMKHVHQQQKSKFNRMSFKVSRE